MTVVVVLTVVTVPALVFDDPAAASFALWAVAAIDWGASCLLAARTRTCRTAPGT